MGWCVCDLQNKKWKHKLQIKKKNENYEPIKLVYMSWWATIHMSLSCFSFFFLLFFFTFFSKEIVSALVRNVKKMREMKTYQMHHKVGLWETESKQS